MVSMSFVKSFVVKTFQEDFNTIVNLLMFVNLQATFEFFSFCYVWCLGYYCISYFSLQVCCNLMPNLIHIPWIHWKGYWVWVLSALWWVIYLINRSLYLFIQGGLDSLQWFDSFPFPSWDVGLWLFLHLSFVSNKMITPFFFNVIAHVKIDIFPF